MPPADRIPGVYCPPKNDTSFSPGQGEKCILKVVPGGIDRKRGIDGRSEMPSNAPWASREALLGT